MISKKFFLVSLLFLTLSMPTTSYASTVPSESENKTLIHSSSYFKAQEGTLNLIVNSIYEDGNNIYLDAYIFNTTNTTINSIANYNLSMFDKNNKLIFNKIFEILPLEYSLERYEGERVTLAVEKSICDLENKDLNNLTWRFSYSFR